MLRLAIDTGGTFTDLVVEGDSAGLRFFKSPTTPAQPSRGVLGALEVAAEDLGVAVSDILARTDLFVLGTTRATNAIVTRRTARTALLATRGHPDVLLLREGGGRSSLFDYRQVYPPPYVPRFLTFEVPERILADGSVHQAVDESAVHAIANQLNELGVEAVAVSFLWSILNPAHELRVGEILEERLPGVPFTLSHQLNPSVREYRRTLSAAIDASLKPLMTDFVRDVDGLLKARGFGGRFLVMTSSGGVMDAEAVQRMPIYTIGSGPAAAPIAGRHFATVDAETDTALVTDAGGTTYDVSLVNRGMIPWTHETAVGPDITGLPSIEVNSIGAGGGSIAWVDQGRLLHVGPESAGADPGPAAYGQGGTRPTVTDACVVLGHIDPTNFLGGRMALDAEFARQAINAHVAQPLGLDVVEAASAIYELAVEHMVGAIEAITIKQGIDPTRAVIVGGGGGAGLYTLKIARRLGCHSAVIPAVASTLSATGAILSDLRTDFASTGLTATDNFDYALARTKLGELRQRADEFRATAAADSLSTEVVVSVEARYAHQVWEIEVPLQSSLETQDDLQLFCESFHDAHDELFAVRDPHSPIEIVTWRVNVRCKLSDPDLHVLEDAPPREAQTRTRPVFFAGQGWLETEVVQLDAVPVGKPLTGPMIIESPTLSVVIDPHGKAEKRASQSLVLRP
jgi:N-methylhydantoinase A